MGVGDDLRSSYLTKLALVQQSMLDRVWPTGRNPRAPWDGDHYTLRGHSRPVSVSTTEAYVLANAVILSEVQTVFEIGTGFGYSASWLAMGLAVRNHGGQVVTMDNASEGAIIGRRLSPAQEIAARLGVDSLVEFALGSSPQDVSVVLMNRMVDIAFLDGNHHGSHPVDDYRAVRPFLTPSSLVLFHDVDASRYTVPRAVQMAMNDGNRVIQFNTSCHLTAAFKQPDWAPLLGRALELACSRTLAPPDEGNRWSQQLL